MKAAIGYCRVSTREQGENRNGLNAQQEAIAAFAKAEGYSIVEWYSEVASGSGADALELRPQLASALKQAKKLKAPLIVSKLDRLSRNVNFISGLMEQETKFIVAALGPDVDKFVLGIYAQLAQQERDLIAERTKAALAQVKIRLAKEGKKLGNSATLRKAQLNGARTNRRLSQAFSLEKMKLIGLMREKGLSSRAIAALLNEQGVRTFHGKAWSHTQVMNTIHIAEGLKVTPEQAMIHAA